MITVKPIGTKLVVEPVEEKKLQTDSGIFLPETATDKPQIGIVKAVGDGRILENGTTMPLRVKVGDRVLYSKFAGTEIQLQDSDKTLLLITERDVLGIIEQTD